MSANCVHLFNQKMFQNSQLKFAEILKKKIDLLTFSFSFKIFVLLNPTLNWTYPKWLNIVGVCLWETSIEWQTSWNYPKSINIIDRNSRNLQNLFLAIKKSVCLNIKGTYASTIFATFWKKGPFQPSDKNKKYLSVSMLGILSVVW